MSDENLRKLKAFKEKLELRENIEIDINDFIKSFMDYYYQDYSLIFNNLEDIHNIIVLLLDKIEDFVFSYKNDKDLDKYIINFDNIEKLSIESKLLILKNFFKKINPDIDLDKIIDDGTFNIISVDLDEAIKKDLLFSGLCGLCEDDEEKIEIKVYDTGLILDLFAWVHEVAHYYNLTIPRSKDNLLLTESISHTYEMLMLDYLSSIGFNYEVSAYQFEMLRNFYAILYQAYYVIKLYIVFDKLGKINIENYKTIFGYDDDYDKCLINFYSAVNKKLTAIFSLTYYSIAAALSPYMYYRWVNDSSFMKNILKFNESIMSKPLIPSLNEIGITGFDDESIKKIQDAIDSFKDEIINGNKYVNEKCDEINDYFAGIVKLFYNDKNMIFERINDIVYLNSYLKKILTDYFKESFPFTDINKLSLANKEEKIRIIMDYYKYMGYEIDMGEMLNNTCIDDIPLDLLKKEMEDNFEALNHYSLVGYNIDSSGYNEVNINNTPYLLDTCAWIHEFRHYLNHPGKERNQESSTLTEVCSFVDELLFADYLEKIGYSYESAFVKCETLNTFYIQILDAYPIDKLLSVYVNVGEVSKENYNNLYSDDEFEDVVDESIPLISEDADDFINGIRYTVACALSIYMYEEYKKDASYLETIKEFEKHINDGDFAGSLKIIGISGLDNESLNKVNRAFEQYKKEINDYLNSDLINMYDINLQKVLRRN